MLFDYKPSSKKLISLGISSGLNLVLFLVFTFYFQNDSMIGINILFLGSFFVYVVQFFLMLKNRPSFTFHKNEIQVQSTNETKILGKLNLLFFDTFNLHSKAPEQLHLVTSEGEYSFDEKEHENYHLVKEYLTEHSQPSIVAKYQYHISLLKERIPSMLVSLVFLLVYMQYFLTLDYSNLFFKIVLFIQGGTLVLYVAQWFYYKYKIKQES